MSWSANSTGIDRRSYLKSIGAATLVGTTGLAGCTGGSDGDSTRLGVSTNFSAGGWVDALVSATEMYAEDQGFNFNLFTTETDVEEQVTHVNQMINQDYDVILLNPFTSDPVASVVEDATDEGIPVFTFDIDAATPAVKMYVSFSDYKAGAKAAGLLMERLRNHEGREPPYEIFNIRAPPGSQIADFRNDGFVDEIEKDDDFSVVGTINGEWGQDTAKTKSEQWMNSNGVPDGIYSAMFAMAMGGLTALKNFDAAHEVGNEDHVSIITLDGSPQINEQISNGMVDAAVDQPNYFYGPLAIELAKMHLEGGDDALPSEGSTVDTDQLMVEPKEHDINENTVELWQEQFWAPATITTSNDHPMLETSTLTITEENADEPVSWGNIWG